MTGSSTHNDGDDANGGGGGKEICGGDAGNNSIKPATLVKTSEKHLKYSESKHWLMLSAA